MSFCLTELHLWSLKSTLHIADRDIGVYQYYDKKDPPVSATEHGNLEEKQRLAESRDYPWTLKNRRPEKLRDSLKELEELMQNSQCVLSKWKNKYICQLLFGSGVLVSLNLSGPQLEKVVIDRSLVGKLISDTISDALLTDSFIILSFLAQNKLCFIQFTKKMDSLDVNKRLEKLSALDYKISYYDIPGPANRTLERHLAINAIQDVVACWWPLVSDGAWPWTPISSEKDRANLLLLGFTQGGLQVLSCVRTEGNPLDVHFGTKQPYHVCTVECSISVDKEPMADSCVYECVRNKLHCMSVTRIPLRSKAISCCRNPTEDKLIVGCEDSSVILYEAHRGVTLLAQAELLPSLISCHPSGAILLVGSNQGELQIFDIALSPINIQLLAEDRLPSKTLQFNKFFDVSSNLVQMQWIAPPVVSQKPERGEIYDLLFLRFNRGPVGVLLFKLGVLTRGQLGLVELIFQYIHCDEVNEAINTLSSMNWDTLGQQCFVSMSAIVNHLLRQRLTPEREAQLEASLGTFYAPARPLLDTTVLEYRDQISKYARRFFHHLLRYRRFEKAFLLAVDIGARDLFMDIHYLALDMGELALAEVARRRACDIDVESVSSGIELLGPLDKRDTLNEAFAGPAPEGENTFPDLLPSTGSKHRHVIQQKIPNGPSNRQAIDRRNEQEGKSRTDSSVTTISDAEGGLKEDCRGQDIGDVGSLRMVHFGLV
ncbi:WD repeat-containing and planar cell polarity effector protein fritz homolog isoform X1 [Cricetulus griseus]|uniref:WD repeat containing planar cell polarity effector n=1 Tax=Cricetulus griseus TaxID=10029 RepID=A0A8C2QGU0_CRIGR|nr:WD repeat-containing and planar cell polarity effector protein fritz homolog isoform X1 [Cricetulus griseus]XP_007640966.1 WD repeat-containing and planar cell polarity effector protein fritz homolog isoform X1 [Cricetulus griseus]XP_016830956.1 WD repeat-containing and planar cell polarity effector protein fritz homolog isoform X1 [Cricetulus griseus]XP_027243851.1 WD repeat-containing and planar cell polarity effector protein fritz homolog isoform X1 [Cricetulus griseus]XP_027243852.1 WD r